MKLSQTQWNHLLSALPSKIQGVFRTDSEGKNYWRKFLAIEPESSFILHDISELEGFTHFVEENKTNLCAGYLSYDLGLALKNVASRHISRQPLVVMHAYSSWLEYVDGELLFGGALTDLALQVEELLSSIQPVPSSKPSLRFEPGVQHYQYQKSIQKILDYIRAGDFYQINYTQRLKASTKLPSRPLYECLLKQHPAAYAAYFEHENSSVHSLSPELFLHFSNGTLTTEPIKGTRSRSAEMNADEQLKQELLSSDKEQAELFMITDLLRNDLGEVCEIGSVRLESVKEVRKLPKVWHTFSRVKGSINSDMNPIDALLSMFPGGSITGCPKKRALEVIDELEIDSRGVYTGSIGYFHPDGEFCFNIAIRTMLQEGLELSLGTGGGITIDSNWEDEWDELLLKASTFE